MQKTLIIFLAASISLLTGCSRTTSMPITNSQTDKQQTTADASLPDGRFAIDPSKSTISWKGAYVTGKTHVGTISLKSGILQIDKQALSGGSFVIDMSSIKESNDTAMLIKHLSSPDFFDVAAYPESKLEIISTAAISDRPGYYKINANLTIKDKTNPLSFEALVRKHDGLIEAQSHFSIDRSLWEVRYGSGKFFQNLGDKIIKDEIEYDIDLQAPAK